MAIDTSGKWWLGSEPDDLKEYLEALSADSYRVHHFRLAQCDCGSVEFNLDASDSEGVARRSCVKCGKVHFICDSEKHWEDADEVEHFRCVECGFETCNVGVGFALYEDSQDIKWLYVSERCARCGVLGSMASWKIGYGPSLQLMDQV